MTLAVLQLDVVFDDPAANAARAVSFLPDRFDLAVLPECFLTGYAVEGADGARRIARGPEILEPLQRAADERGGSIVVGYASAEADGTLANVAALVSPGEAPRRYVKTHLPELGFDRHVTPGDALPVFDLPWGRLGILVCFDLRFPEAARSLALQGADLVVLPTNWPQGAEGSARVLAPARAMENRVFLASCDRVGTEGGFSFLGESGVFDPGGRTLAMAGTEEQVLIVEFDPAEARVKRMERDGGRYATEAFLARRPDLYGRLTAS